MDMHTKRMAHALGVLVILASSLLIAPGAQATKTPPIMVEIVPPEPGHLPKPGEVFSLTLRLTSAVAAGVGDFVVTSPRLPDGGGDAWELRSFGVPMNERIQLAAMTPLDIACELMPVDPTQPLVIALKFEGRLVRRAFHLLPRPGPGTLLPVDPFESGSWRAAPPLPFPAGSYVRPNPAPSRRAAQDPALVSAEELAGDAPRSDSDKSGYNIQVWGRFVYRRPDGIVTGVDGATVWIMDEDFGFDEELAVTVTEPDGTFNIIFNYDMAEDPDVYLLIEAINGVIEVEDASVLESTYSWESYIRDDTTESQMDFGILMPGDASDAPAAQILSTATRTWRWFASVDSDYENIAGVEIQWPQDGIPVSNYNALMSTIEISSDANWEESAVAHEYNHHWMDQYSKDEIDDYCNDPPYGDVDGDCGHTMWCEESPEDAWGEGFGDWVSYSVCHGMEAAYGLAPVDSLTFEYGHRDVENIKNCDESMAEGNPWRTEGIFAALLLDIEDAENEDLDRLPGGDYMTMGRAGIIGIAADLQPLTPLEFIADFVDTYPQWRRDLWSVARYCGFMGLDVSPPGIVTNLTSPGHAPGSVSTDGTITYTWTRAPDDLSEVNGYCVSMSLNAPAAPDTTFNLPDVMSYTTEDVGPGRWYFNIRAQDRAERWATQYASYGPIEVRAAFSADVRPWADTGWATPLVPRPTADATNTNVPLPTALVGDAASTYYSLCIQNIGEDAAPYGWENTVYVDGWQQNQLYLPSNLGSGLYYKWPNRGPTTIRGGRHTLSVWTDSNEANAEMNEFDNRYAGQWVWTPATMALGQTYTRACPPDPHGGVLVYNPLYNQNCDGMRTAAASGYYQSVTVRALSDTVDYDCRLHPQSTGPTNGFARLNITGRSTRPAGCIDAVFVRPNNAGADIWDMGVINVSGGLYDYTAVRNASSTIATGSTLNLILSASTWLSLRQFQVTATQPLTISVDSDPALGVLQMVWLADNFTAGGVLDADGYARADSTGHMEISIPSAAIGWHGLALFRDPVDIPGGGTPPAVAMTVRIITTPPDLEPATPAGWAHAFVPRADTNGTPTSVPEPPTLTGDAAATWYNLAWKNTGGSESGEHYYRTYLDGVQRTSAKSQSLAVGGTKSINSATAYNFPGGRHLLAMKLDPDNLVPEVHDRDNVFGMQWSWIPTTLARATPVTRAAAPSPTGGWSALPAAPGFVVDFNCDGVRLPAPAINGNQGWWQAVATMPGAASDVDPRLHEAVDGAKLGFKAPHVMSGWGAGESDFVLVNHRVTNARAFDVGVLGVTGAEPYTVEAVASTYLAANPSGRYGSYSLPAQEILKLHEVELPAGPLAIGLSELEGGIDWGLSLYSGELPYHAKMPAQDQYGWLAWQRQPGEGDWLVLDVPAAGRYCLAVWKAGAADLAKSGRYELEFTALTGTPDVPAPSATRLVAVQPNPFNPRTTILFDLAVPGDVRISVYNLEGRRIRHLLDAPRAAGRGEIVWDGTDDRGQAMASGVYLIRLETPSGADGKSVTLVR